LCRIAIKQNIPREALRIIFSPGDIRCYEKAVTEKDTATFEAGQVHPVYATFALGRDAEWACRLFVLEMKEADEEGIGTFLNVEHISPALLGSNVKFTAVIDKIEGNTIICSFEAAVEGRLIAKGKTGQKILKKEKLDRLFDQLSRE
jgi:fluoroacetyl-CoA thioesterase